MHGTRHVTFSSVDALSDEAHAMPPRQAATAARMALGMDAATAERSQVTERIVAHVRLHEGRTHGCCLLLAPRRYPHAE